MHKPSTRPPAYLHGVQRQPQVALVGGVVGVFDQLLGTHNPPVKTHTPGHSRTCERGSEKFIQEVNLIACVCARWAVAGTCVLAVSEIARRCLATV